MGLVMVSLGEVAAIATILAFVATVYWRKADRLDSKRQREQYLTEELKGRGWREGELMIEIDSVTIDENDSIEYKLRRKLLRPLEGKVIIGLIVGQCVIDEAFWDTEIADIIREELVDFQYIDSEITGQHMIVMLEVDSLDKEEIITLVVSIVKSVKIAVEGETMSIERFNPANSDHELSI